MKLYILIFFIVIISCNNSEKENFDFIINPCSEDIKSSLDKFDNDCDKLNYIKNHSNFFFCFGSFISKMEDLSAHMPSYDLGTFGAYYRSDSILNNDIEAWENFLNCK